MNGIALPSANIIGPAAICQSNAQGADVIGHNSISHVETTHVLVSDLAFIGLDACKLKISIDVNILRHFIRVRSC